MIKITISRLYNVYSQISNFCGIGKIFSDMKCDISKEPTQISNITKHNLTLLSLRVEGFNKNVSDCICFFHYDKYINNYEHYYKRCCDPYKNHYKVVSSNLKVLCLNTVLNYKIISNNAKLIPG